jgi:hypothetical protein
MNLDEDEPPSLVDVEEDDEVPQLEDGKHVVKVPITIVTGMQVTPYPVLFTDTSEGYLGAGKTTLMNYILKAKHGKKIAVILNGKHSFITTSRWGQPFKKILANTSVTYRIW